jgi:Ni,Fe-hydrogenase III large subunit/Ni,Fe-hydrogenase III component G
MNIESIRQYIPENTKTEFFGNKAVFEAQVSQIKEVVNDLRFNKNLPLKFITATDEREHKGCFKIWYIFGVPKESFFVIVFIRLTDTDEFPSMALNIYEALNYERRIQTFFGLTPVASPDTRPIILHENWPSGIFPLRKDFNWMTRPETAAGEYEFQKVEGEGIYEIPVGPIHAGIIEPGHFRFSVAGEEIVYLEPRLGYTHKGSEKLFEVLPLNDKVRLSEKISGDSSFSHSLAFCQALESLSDLLPPKRARYLRVIYLELERLANHFGDIGAIMMDTGFNFGGASGARLREMIMQINARITGSRFLRGVNLAGGVAKDISENEKKILPVELEIIVKDFSEVIKIAENNTSLLNRMRGTGVLSYEIAKDYGVVGIAAKSVGIKCDVRIDFPYAAYDELQIGEAETEQGGDVYARFRVRVKEVRASVQIIQNALNKMPEGPIYAPFKSPSFKKNFIEISIVEGWRGEIMYFLTTDADGNISRVAPRDPSFINWAALGHAGFSNLIPDFPLINKSFNLSYSGNDL